MDRKQNKKNDIINASIGLMHLRGYNGTSVKDITDIAGIPKGSFYNYFKDKEHYAVDALNYFFFELFNNYTSILIDKNLKPLERINKFFKSLISLLEKQDLKLGCFIGNITQEMGNTSELISDTVAKIHSELETMIYNNLIEAYENKTLKKELDLKVLASFIVNSWQGTLLRTKVTNDQTILNAFYTVLNEDLLK
ncbi:MAG: TetR/AcrR family transcriptional regulator [Sedimentisphaeraceae bacterium JB056]